MTVFLVIGGVGLGILLFSLIFGELLDGVFDAVDGMFDSIDLDLDAGDGHGSFLSGPVLGAFLGAFGLGGSLLLATTPAGPALATVAGLANGVVIGWVALRVTQAFMDMPTDEPVRVDDLLGKSGKVVLPIPADGFGQVTVRHGGQPMKLSARADRAIDTGAAVIVTAVLSTSAVQVTAEDRFFGLTEPHHDERRK